MWGVRESAMSESKTAIADRTADQVIGDLIKLGGP